MVDILLDVQERDVGTLRRVQKILQSCVHVNHLARLQTVSRDILVYTLGHLGTRNLLTGCQLQESA